MRFCIRLDGDTDNYLCKGTIIVRILSLLSFLHVSPCMKPEPEVQAFAMQNMGKMKKDRIVKCKEQGEEEKMQRG